MNSSKIKLTMIIMVALNVITADILRGQTINIGPNQYAFQYTADPDYGMYFSLTNTQYELRNSVAAPVWAVDANNGKYGNNIRFSAGADILIDADRYAFRYAGDPNYGLYFSLANTRYEFRTLNASSVFHIDANNGNVTGIGDAVFNDVSIGKGGGDVSTNTAVGNSALVNNTTGNDNTAVGNNTLLNTADQTHLTAVGSNALSNNGVGAFAWEASYNTAVGSHALYNNTKGSGNTAVGQQALYENTEGGSNTALGSNALKNNTTGGGNTAVGQRALFNHTTGLSNTAAGVDASYNNTTGHNNSTYGHKALYNNTTGNANTAIGLQTLLTNTSGTHNTAVGYLADIGSGDLTNASAIGANAYVAADNSLVLGSINGVNGAISSTNVGIGATQPSKRLHVYTSGDATDGIRVGYSNGQYADIMYAGSGGGGLILNSRTGGTWADITFQSNGTTRMFMDYNGNFGLGVTAPTQKLHVNGNILLNDDTDGIIFSAADASNNPMITLFESGVTNADRMVFAHSSTHNDWGLQYRDLDDSWHFLEAGASKVTIGSNSIGAGYMLTVDGRILCDELRVQDPGSWPDFVFDEEYDLLTLDEVEKHIDGKKHLPGIPSAEEVEESGVPLGEISRKLLQKIEELTLYTIQQQKEIDELRSLHQNFSGK